MPLLALPLYLAQIWLTRHLGFAVRAEGLLTAPLTRMGKSLQGTERANAGVRGIVPAWMFPVHFLARGRLNFREWLGTRKGTKATGFMLECGNFLPPTLPSSRTRHLDGLLVACFLGLEEARWWKFGAELGGVEGGVCWRVVEASKYCCSLNYRLDARRKRRNGIWWLLQGESLGYRVGGAANKLTSASSDVILLVRIFNRSAIRLTIYSRN